MWPDSATGWLWRKKAAGKYQSLAGGDIVAEFGAAVEPLARAASAGSVDAEDPADVTGGMVAARRANPLVWRSLFGRL